MKLRVTHAKSSYKGKISTTPLAQYSYRDEKGTPRHKTVLSLAKMPKFVVKVVEEALKCDDTSVLDEFFPKSSFKYLFSITIGAAFVAIAVLNQLSVIELLKQYLTKARAVVIIAFLIERIIAEKPLSIAALQRQFNHSPTHFLLDAPRNPDLDTWYGALEGLEKVRTRILADLFEQKPSKNQVFLYDITSSYFEGEKCPLGEFGYNRDGKKGKKQVVIGVICDSEGRPVWCDVFKGSTSDQTTVRQQLVNLKETLGVEEFIFVGDRGMVTNARIEELNKEGWWESFGYITALKRGELLRLIDDEDHPMQPELFDHNNLVEIEHNGERFVLCHNPYKREEDGRVRERLLAKTEAKLEMISRNVKAGRLKRKDKIAKRLHRQYKDLQKVEQTFRTMKTTKINMRPMRVWNEQHVRGYIFGCFLAYLATWEIRKRLDPLFRRDGNISKVESLQEVFRNLSGLTIGVYELGSKTVHQLSRISTKNKDVFKQLKVPSISSVIGSRK